MTAVNGRPIVSLPRTPVSQARDIVAAHAAAADRDRVLSEPAVRAITRAGFPRHFVPSRYGGRDGTFAVFLRDVSTLAEGCAAAGWCASLYAAHARMATFLPVEGQEELWGEEPDVRIAAGVIPGGEVSDSDGGWTLSGSWGFLSGVDFADWILVSGWEPGTEPRRLRFFLVPKKDCRIEDTWFTVGMRGTGSRTAVLDGLFVPRHRSFAQETMLAGRQPGRAGPAAPVPFRMINGLTMTGPVLGVVRGALRHWSSWISTKTEMSMGRVVHAREKPAVQAALARSTAAADTAELLLSRICALADAGQPIDDGVVARSHRDFAVVADSLTDAVERVLRSSGARAQTEENVIARAWRDVHTATSHAALQFDTNAAVYAQYVLGS
ncbi:hydrolase [Nucisporomicrobium flavum]|jgi:two-component flavin-dependent monooxygenase|uniref:hydrolase n=1 Tax=Nucisporomicrobium flavum TaxID=2785915 RepID=UPI0018F48FCA|nr:hydrolase [Nucisporomicrobium flavum]